MKIIHGDSGDIGGALKSPQFYVYDKATFFDFDQYQETAYKWKLDFRLMSTEGFNSTRTSLITDKVIINLSQLSGQLVQYGLCPPGFRTFVIPVADCKDFYWLKRNITQNQIMAFPINGTLDAISFDGFQVYTISITNSHLESLLNTLKFDHASKLLSEDEVVINVPERFIKSFQRNANLLLNRGSACHTTVFESVELNNVLTSELPRIILREFEYNLGDVSQARPRKRDRVLAKEIDIIEASSHEMPKIGQLCKSVGVSERTLEYAFLEGYQLTSKSYIKATQLNKINKELARNTDQKISEIAAKYGFWHMGQFAADFKIQFGVLPSEYRNNS